MSATTETTPKTCASEAPPITGDITFSADAVAQWKTTEGATVWRNDGPGLPLTAANLQRALEPPRKTRRKTTVVLTPTGRARLATNARTYVPSDDPAPADGTRQTQQQTRLDVQIDVYGPTAAENVQIIGTLLRDTYGCDFLRPYLVQPLYCGDPRQMPLVTGEQQYLARWMLMTKSARQPHLGSTIPA